MPVPSFNLPARYAVAIRLLLLCLPACPSFQIAAAVAAAARASSHSSSSSSGSHPAAARPSPSPCTGASCYSLPADLASWSKVREGPGAGVQDSRV